MKGWIGSIFSFLFLILSLSIIASLFFPQYFPFTQEQARDFVSSFKPFDIIIFVALQIIQAVIPPISHYFTSILGGYMYGPLWGGIYNWIGRVIGQFIAYGIGLWIYKNYLKNRLNFFEKNKLYKYIVADEKTLYIRAAIIFMMIFLPFFPDDELSYMMGTFNFPFKVFAIVTLVGHLGGSFALAYMGSGLEFSGPYFWFLTTVTIAVFVALVWYLKKYSLYENSK